MSSHQCNLCKKVFKLKTDLKRHQNNKKSPCISAEEIIENQESNTNDDRKQIEKFLSKCHELLRDKEGIVTMDALMQINMLLFLRLINPQVKDGDIDLLDIKKYKDNFPKASEKYIKFALFENIVEDGVLSEEARGNVHEIINCVFKQILWIHPKTANITCDKLPKIKHNSTYEIILKEISKINWETINSDIKGAAYEHFLNTELTGGSLGQFFTRREVCDYMIQNVNVDVGKKIMDPFMGTCGFLTRAYKILKQKYKNNEEAITKKIIDETLYGIEKNDNTSVIGSNNCLLATGYLPENVKQGDSLRCYMTDKVDIVLTNPPFGIKGMNYDDDSSFPSMFNEISKKDYLPVKSNDAICLALQMIQYVLKDKGEASIVVPNGRQLNGTNKSEVAIRKMLIDNCNLHKVTILPPGTFLPYTPIDVCVLFFIKGQKTQHTKFVSLGNDYKTETELINVKHSKLKKNSYILRHRDYIEPEKISGSLNFHKLRDLLCESPKIKPTNKYERYHTCKIKQWFKGIEKCEEKTFDDVNKLNMLQCGNIVLSKMGAKKGGIAIVSENDTNCVISNDCIQYNILNNANPKFIMHTFEHGNLVDKINDKSCGAVRERIKNDDILNMDVPIVALSVQNALVKELNSYYAQKENTQNYIKNINQRIEGTFDDMINKCKNINDTLKNVISLSTGTYITKENTETGIYPIYGGGGISGSSNIFNKENEYIIAKDGVSANCVRYVNEKFFMNHHAWTFDVINDKVIKKFIGHFLLSNQMKIFELTSGSAQKGINQETFLNIQINVPSIEDQKKIVATMEKYYAMIELLKDDIVEIDGLIGHRFEHHINSCKKQENYILDDEPEDKKVTVEGKNKIKKVIESENESSDEEITVKSKKVVNKKAIKKKIDTESESENESTDEEIVVKLKKVVKKKVVKKKVINKKVETESETEDDVELMDDSESSEGETKAKPKKVIKKKEDK